MATQYFLVTENAFHVTYLVAKWLAGHGELKGFQGVVLRDDPIPDDLALARADFHREHAYERALDPGAWAELERLYPDLSITERAMVTEFGVPPVAVSSHSNTVYLGKSLNGAAARQWIELQCAGTQKPYLFVFLDRIFAPWWIGLTGSRIVNAHSAVLPHARGMFAIEQAAARGDSELFRDAAGATAHFVDSGVDTGPIIEARKFRDPFSFDSIWSCKGNSFMLAFELLDQVARELTGEGNLTCDGTPQARSPHDAPEFKRRDFTPPLREKSAAEYLAMRAAARRPRSQ